MRSASSKLRKLPNCRSQASQTEQMPKPAEMEDHKTTISPHQAAAERLNCAKIDITGSSRGQLLWRSLRNIRKYVAKVSEPLTKGRRRSLRRQLSFEVDDLEKIILGVKPREAEISDDSETSEDEEMRIEVESIVKDVIGGASSAGRVENVDLLKNRMRQVEKECAELKKNLDEVRQLSQERKRKKSERNSFAAIHKSPYKMPKSGYGSDDHGYDGSLDLQMELDVGNKIKKEPSVCSVCGKLQTTLNWRCGSCRNFWSRLVRAHAKGKLLPRCDHEEPAVVCKGCRRRKYEAAMAVHAPNTPLGIPPCPPPSRPVDINPFKEESREIRIEYW